jgi:hypothetical protein
MDLDHHVVVIGVPHHTSYDRARSRANTCSWNVMSVIIANTSSRAFGGQIPRSRGFGPSRTGRLGAFPEASRAAGGDA